MIKKVIVPIAGLGSRMLPVTKSIPKEMLPIDGTPIIQFVVEEALSSGFSEIIFITNSRKTSVKKYFKKNTEFEQAFKNKSNNPVYKLIKKISKFEEKITFVNQKSPKGLGHAILCAKSLIGNDPFAVMLPDMIIDSKEKKHNLALMKKNFDKSGESSILLGKIKKSDVQSYGIAKLKNKTRNNIFFPLADIIEKPSEKEAPSNFFVVGRYVFDNEILKFLSEERPDSTGEIQLSGAISNFLKTNRKLNGLLLDGEVYDCGSKLGYLSANLVFSFKDRNIKKEVLKVLKK